MENAQKILEGMYDKLDKFLKTETVIGEPIVVGEVKVIPIITASFGLGGGAGADDDNINGAGGGLGCKISPNALLVIRGDNVEMMPLQSKSSLDKIIDKVPEMMDKIDQNKVKKTVESAAETAKEKKSAADEKKSDQ